ncbi:MAG: TM2 domain-containing protein [Mycoplasmatales bacterium]
MKVINNDKYILTLLMCIFFGTLGVHRFINQKPGTGLLMLLTFGGFGIWWFIDIILLVTNNFENQDGEIIGYGTRKK